MSRWALYDRRSCPWGLYPSFIAIGSVRTRGKIAPHARLGESDVAGVIKSGVLHSVAGCEGTSPKQPGRVNQLRFVEVNDHPLRMQRVVFVSKIPIEIGIALPETLTVAVIQTRIAIVVSLIDCIAASRQAITIRSPDG